MSYDAGKRPTARTMSERIAALERRVKRLEAQRDAMDKAYTVGLAMASPYAAKHTSDALRAATSGEASANPDKCRHSEPSGLVERVAAAIDADAEARGYLRVSIIAGGPLKTIPRAAIEAVAEWLESEGEQRYDGYVLDVADILRAELEKGR